MGPPMVPHLSIVGDGFTDTAVDIPVPVGEMRAIRGGQLHFVHSIFGSHKNTVL